MCVLGVGEKVEVWCKLESLTCVMEYFGVQRNFFVDARLLLLSMRGFVGGRSLLEESLAVFRGEFPHTLV